MKSKYDKRGVSSDKKDVHEAIQSLDKSIIDNTFCKILPDYTGNDSDFCNVMHADTAGTKSALAYIYWKETGDLSVWEDLSQDAIVMNIDDLACVGALDNIVISSTIGRNRKLISKDVIKSIIEGTNNVLQKLRSFNINIFLAGGETADVGDIVRTIDVGITAFARIKKSDVVPVNISHGNVIIGLSSSGTASYETSYNSGIGSNGLTAARHDILHHSYSKLYPESFDPTLDPTLIYAGDKLLTDIESASGISYGKLLLSPTRTYTPLIKNILAKYRKDISGFIHCTGGGQTKVLHFIGNDTKEEYPKYIHIIKDKLFPPPPLFKQIQQISGTSWKEMYQIFNMGHRMEIYCNENMAVPIINMANQFNIEAKIIGYCENSNKNMLTISNENGSYEYEK